MKKSKLAAATAVVGTTCLAAFAPAGHATTVCNEAENSPLGGYVVSGGIEDPNPPAFLRGSQMRVGNEDAAGLEHAADQAPALRQCAPEDDDGGGDGGGVT